MAGDTGASGAELLEQTDMLALGMHSEAADADASERD